MVFKNFGGGLLKSKILVKRGSKGCVVEEKVQKSAGKVGLMDYWMLLKGE